MLHAGGQVWGYREERITGSRTPRLPPLGRLRTPKLVQVHVAHLWLPSYDYRCISGDAEADWPEDWTVLPWRCRMSSWTLYGGRLEIQISFDGSVIQNTRVIRDSMMTLDSFSHFRVRREEPGIATWYQLHVSL